MNTIIVPQEHPLRDSDRGNERQPRVARIILIILGVYGVLSTGLVMAISFLDPKPNPDGLAILKMAAGLIVLWVILGGLVMHRLRPAVVAWVRSIRLPWWIKFVVFCTLLAMLEEAVTTGMTNLAPWFGAVSDAARITASKNYFEVICLNSVVVFIPSYFALALLLRWFDFKPVEVMLLYGLYGTLAEAMTFGAQNLGSVGFWVFVYGLMVWLPACAVPPERGQRPLRWWAGPLGLVVCYLAAVPFVLLVLAVRAFFPGMK